MPDTRPNFFIHLRSEFDCLLHVNGAFAGRLPASGGLPDSRDFIHIEAGYGEVLAVTAAPLSFDKEFGWKRLPVSCMLTAGSRAVCNVSERPSAAALTVTGANAQAIRLPKNHYEVLLTEEILYGYCPPTPAAQNEFYFRNERHIVTVFKDTLNQAVCEGGGRLYVHVLPVRYIHEQTTFETDGQTLIVKIGGTVRGMRYLAAIAFDGEYRQEINLLADRLETEGNEIQTLTQRRDIAHRAAVMTYALSEGRYELKNKYMVYLSDGPRKPLHDRFIPYALFEAVKAGDYAEARSFLTEDLAAVIKDDGALADFFDPYDVVRENAYYDDHKNAVLLTGNGKGDLLELSVWDGKIDNMRIL
ncbi:hypothetical protein FACS1894211_07340 [Clostridia bacterium]|nr:hypothetical protein FACS1894211_07340 [Clostridia bacterium]